MKICSTCKIEKTFDDFHAVKGKYKSACKTCSRKAFRQWYKNNPEYRAKNKDRMNATKKKWLDANPEKRKEACDKWVKNNPEKAKLAGNNWKNNNQEKVKSISKRSREKHKEKRSKEFKEWYYANKERAAELNRVWCINNRDKTRLKTIKRKAIKLKATPSWANEKYIGLFYKLAKIEEDRTKLSVHVDHIVPLNSPLVCGFHVEHNLQLMVANENLSKSNRHWPDMWGD